MIEHVVYQFVYWHTLVYGGLWLLGAPASVAWFAGDVFDLVRRDRGR